MWGQKGTIDSTSTTPHQKYKKKSKKTFIRERMFFAEQIYYERSFSESRNLDAQVSPRQKRPAISKASRELRAHICLASAAPGQHQVTISSAAAAHGQRPSSEPQAMHDGMHHGPQSCMESAFSFEHCCSTRLIMLDIVLGSQLRRRRHPACRNAPLPPS